MVFQLETQGSCSCMYYFFLLIPTFLFVFRRGASNSEADFVQRKRKTINEDKISFIVTNCLVIVIMFEDINLLNKHPLIGQ